jgi:DnaJ-domain-containing protein 1
MKRLGAMSLRVGQRDLLNPKDVKAEITFDRPTVNGAKRYVVRCSKWANHLDNLRAAERTIFYFYRAIAEYGAETNEKAFAALVDQFFAGFEALPDDTVLMLGSGKQAWWEVLGVEKKATKAEVISAFRALARIHHPDTGGDVAMFKRLRVAYEEALDGIA